MVQTSYWIPKFQLLETREKGSSLSHPSAMTCAPPSLCCWTCVSCDHVTNNKQVPTAGPCRERERGHTSSVNLLVPSCRPPCVCVSVCLSIVVVRDFEESSLSHLLSLPRDPSSTFWQFLFSYYIAPVTSSIVTTKNEKTRHSPPLCCCCCYSLQDKGQKKKSWFEM